MELLLIRHGLPVRVDDAGGPADPALAPEGRAQALVLAEWLSGEAVDAVWTSPLRRARETAEPLAASKGLELVVDDELAEFDRANHFYVPIEELKESGDPRWEELLADWTGEEAEVDRRTFRKVVVTAVERVVEAHPGGAAAVVCHGGVLNAYLSHVLGVDATLFFEPGYTSISRVLAGRSGRRQVVSLNETAHLRG